jgi:hypothetical protein
MILDTAKLGHSVDDRGRICVHFPKTRKKGEPPVYGVAFDIGDVPDFYWTDPPNAITAERVGIWRAAQPSTDSSPVTTSSVRQG